jgi:DNA-binding GntR family transcriptional regulator
VDLEKTDLSTETLADVAYQRLSELIIELELPPGALLSENMLSKRLAIGRTPIRESLKRLARDNLVQILPHRGVVVTEINIQQQLSALEVRRPVELILVTGAARRSTTAQRQCFLKLADDFEAAAAQEDAKAYMVVDRLYDRLIDESAGNYFASEALKPIHGIVRRFWVSRRGSEDWHSAGKLQIKVARSIGQGDAKAASAAITAIMDLNERLLRDLSA